MKRLIKVLLVTLALLLPLTACSGGNQGKDNNSGEPTLSDDTLMAVLSGDPTSFHPDFKSDDNAWPVNQNLFNRLVKLNAYDQVLPDLAETWEWNEDSTQVTFHLHEGVKWHDGEPFTSEDVKWTYDTLIAEKWNKSDSFASVDSIECPDENTVVMNLKYPDVSLIAKLSWYGTFIMPKHLYEGTDTATNEYNMKPVGTGPFKFVEFQKGVQVVMERNEDYWGDKAKVARVIYSILPDPTTALQAFINGEVDYYTAIPTQNANDFDNDPNYEVYPVIGMNRSYIAVNIESERFKDVRVRQAIAYGIDRQMIWDRCAGGTGAIANTFIAPNTGFADENYQMPQRDVAKAQQLLEDAGFTKDANGIYFSTEMKFFDSGYFKDAATIIQNNLKEVGIDLKLTMMEYAAWGDTVKLNHDFEMSMSAGYQGPDVSGVSGRVGTGTSMNFMGYSNPEMDALLEKGVQVSDETERKAVYSEVQRIMSEDMPIILFMDNGSKIPVKKILKGTPYQEPTRASSSELTYVEFVSGE
ncbi:ABC transporter substrate-binding protein [Holdemania massiliensis]|uniref:ABC transporter substrate-binding protein n=1 Tax=Holdemania massiliensis TaxID=1468449 RepID=UPI001F06333D|nr:ABC transporter substrate-binding protein [Holdemania massiliensis]MCH1940171.1 ABC transporter substrate-binding protein [Holdemania massiliensis]